MRLIRKAIPVLIAIITACSLVVSAEDQADYSNSPDGQSSSQASSQAGEGEQSQDGEEAPSNAVAPLYFDAATMEQLHGTWKGRFHTPLIPVETLTYFEDAVELNIIDDAGQPKLYITVDSFGSNYTQSIQWWATNGELHFIFNDLPWQATVAVRLNGESTLTGTYSQYGREYEMNFYRITNVPVRKDQESQYTFEGEPFEVWQERLQKYAQYANGSSKVAIPFTYELYAQDKSRELLNAANFAGAAYQPYNSDVEQMAAIMDVLCDRFLHNGASGMPEATDTSSIMYFANENNGIECRGLSAMLSEVLRSVGIPAKPVMCIPYNDPCDDCHVVVHAWSHDLRQWVMLDPTYRLVLRDIDGNYLSIPQIREKLLSGEQMVANSNAGHNGTPFSMEYYRAYMTKNMFRFSSLTNAVFEGEKAPGGNRTRMLVPKGWQLPYAWSRPEIVTNDADAFWAAPKIESDYE